MVGNENCDGHRQTLLALLLHEKLRGFIFISKPLLTKICTPWPYLLERSMDLIGKLIINVH